MNADGTNRQHVTSVPLTTGISDITDPSWSPDGTRIAFASNEGKGYTGYNIFTIRVDDSDKRTVVEDARWPAWSPDGKCLCCIKFIRKYQGASSEHCVSIVDLSTGKRKDLGIHPGAPIAARDLCWSPDGSKIAYTAMEKPYNIYIMDTDGQKRQVLVERGLNPAWSPDGKKIAFVRHGGGRQKDSIFVVDQDGANVTKLITGADSPSWAGDVVSAGKKQRVKIKTGKE